MSKAIWRFKLLDKDSDDIPVKRIDIDDFEELSQVSLVISGKETRDPYLSICGVANHIKFKSETFKISNVLTQNGSIETEIDVTCIKVLINDE